MNISFILGAACRYKNINYLKRKFKTIDQAEADFKIQYFDSEVPLLIPSEASSSSTPISKLEPGETTSFSPVFNHSPHVEKLVSIKSRGQGMESICSIFSNLSKIQQVQLVDWLFSKLLMEHNIPYM